jgi:hypothetical protein
MLQTSAIHWYKSRFSNIMPALNYTGLWALSRLPAELKSADVSEHFIRLPGIMNDHQLRHYI